jgi:hypothetical protein
VRSKLGAITALIVLAGVLAVFLFPAGLTPGPFSAGCGPATALRANRAAQLIHLGMVRCWRAVFALSATVADLSFWNRRLRIRWSDANDLSETGCALRC